MKQFLMTCCFRSMTFLTGVLLGTVATLLALSGFAHLVEAASYNVFFNNVEQGPNSQANPVLSVPLSVSTPETGNKSGVNPLETAMPTAASTTASTTASTPEGTAASPIGDAIVALPASGADRTGEAAARKLRLSLLAQTATGRDLRPGDGAAPYGGALQLSLFPIRDFGLTAFTGLASGRDFYYGGELELVPVRLGVFGLNNFVEGGVVLGANSLRKEAAEGSWGTIHAGAKVTLNLGDRFGLVTGLRTNLTDRTHWTYILADAGVSIRF